MLGALAVLTRPVASCDVSPHHQLGPSGVSACAARHASPFLMSTLPPDSAYACLALSTGMVSSALPSEFSLGDDVVASRRAPVGLPDHWREPLGSIECRRLEAADLFITTTRSLTWPAKEEEPRERLDRRTLRFYTALIIAVPGLKVTHARLLGGEFRDGVLTLDRTAMFPQTNSVAGTPASAHVGLAHLKDVSAVARGSAAVRRLGGTPEVGDFRRLKRAVHALRSCVESPYLDHRLHQAIRVLEALLAPGKGATGKAMATRASKLLGDMEWHSDLIQKLYTLRSKVEHLYGPAEAIRLAWRDSPPADDRAGYVHFADATHTAEFLARAMLIRVLSTDALWPHFSSEEHIRRFWTSEHVKAWGEPLGSAVQAAMRAFDSQAVEAFFDRGDADP